MNSVYHARSSARKWGGAAEQYQQVHDFIDSSKSTLGDVRHRALYHHTLGIYLCERIFGSTVLIHTNTGSREIPTRLIAERHVLEDLGRIPSPADYLKNTSIELWMSGSQRREMPLSHLLRSKT